MKAKALGIIAGVLIAGTSFVASAAAWPAPFEGSSTLQADGLVKSVDQVGRSVTILDAQGGEASFNLSDASNLAQIRQGGKVHVRMMRNAVISVTRGADGQVSAAPPAQADGIRNVAATVEDVDQASGVITLRSASGSVFHMQSREASKLAGVQPGMQVMVVFAQQINVAVAPAQ